MKKNIGARSRIFLGLLDVAGYMFSLQKGFEKIGVRADFYNLTPHKYSYRQNNKCPLCDLYFSYFQKWNETNNAISRFFLHLVLWGVKLVIFIKSLFLYDVFIFSTTSSFFGLNDLPVLKFFRKTIIFVFLGSDVRPAYLSGNLIDRAKTSDGKLDVEMLAADSVQKNKYLAKIEQYADYTVNHPPTALFQNKPFILFSALGFPFWEGKIKDTSIPETELSDNTVTIVHAPSNPKIKGSLVFAELIEKLKNEGYLIDYKEITNKTNAEVLAELSRCDLVIDELYSDIPLGGLGTEAAFFGKPTINCGYYNEQIQADLAPEFIPPSVYCTPEELEEKLRVLIKNKEIRTSIGQESKQFVFNNWESSIVARKYIKLINGNVPENWLYHPKRITYFFGYGQNKKALKQTLHTVVQQHGKEGLHLKNKPELLSAIQAFINQ